ncbi:hypothetical protein TNCV_1864731 [Trichonephila clavipes]|nr:hypothetical protein TNCV_1864731 [Trichonephila clavipes]
MARFHPNIEGEYPRNGQEPPTAPTINLLRELAIGVPARISSQSSHHCWRSPLPHTPALIQRDFGCVPGVQQTKQLPHVAKVGLAKDPESEQPAGEAIQSGDGRRTFGQCVPRVVAHYPVEIWLWPSPEDKEGQLAPTSRRCSAGCLKYQQCVLEECESDII